MGKKELEEEEEEEEKEEEERRRIQRHNDDDNEEEEEEEKEENMDEGRKTCRRMIWRRSRWKEKNEGRGGIGGGGEE